MTRLPLIFAIVLALVMGPAPPAAAAQLDARDRPRASGPLTFEGKSCVKRTIRSRGRVVAVTRTCVFLYSFSPTSEIDPLRDYGAAWVQTSVDPRNRWCATKVRSSVLLPDEAQGHARAPNATSVAASRDVTTRLIVDAEGSALADGVVRQTYRLYPNGASPSLSQDRRALKVKWTGRTARTVAFALGLEFSAGSEDAILGTLGSFGAALGPLSFERC